jgi:putative FmdB family regulatory protein
MPLYEFACQGCGHQFEELTGASSRVLCPRCEGEDLKRLFSVFAVGKGAGPRPSLAQPAPCGACGDPRGPGSCARD